MLVESDAVVAEPVHLLPCLQMFRIGACRHVRFKMLSGQRVGKLVASLQMLELLAIREQVENKDFHRRSPPSVALLPADGRSRLRSSSAKLNLSITGPVIP